MGKMFGKGTRLVSKRLYNSASAGKEAQGDYQGIKERDVVKAATRADELQQDDSFAGLLQQLEAYAAEHNKLQGSRSVADHGVPSSSSSSNSGGVECATSYQSSSSSSTLNSSGAGGGPDTECSSSTVIGSSSSQSGALLDGFSRDEVIEGSSLDEISRGVEDEDITLDEISSRGDKNKSSTSLVVGSTVSKDEAAEASSHVDLGAIRAAAISHLRQHVKPEGDHWVLMQCGNWTTHPLGWEGPAVAVLQLWNVGGNRYDYHLWAVDPSGVVTGDEYYSMNGEHGRGGGNLCDIHAGGRQEVNLGTRFLYGGIPSRRCDLGVPWGLLEFDPAGKR
jgi:hypothetical protein